MNEQTEQDLTPAGQLQELIDQMALMQTELNNLKARAGSLPLPPLVSPIISSTSTTRRKTLKRLGLALLGGAAAATALGTSGVPAQARVIANRQSSVGLYVAPPGSQDPGGNPPTGRVYGLVTTNQLAGLNYNVLPDDNVAIVALCGSGTAINAHSNDSYAINASSSAGTAVYASTGSGLNTQADALLYAVKGEGNGNSGGVQGKSGSSTGVNGVSESGPGCRGVSTQGTGVYGISSDSYGVYGQSTNSYAGSCSLIDLV